MKKLIILFIIQLIVSKAFIVRKSDGKDNNENIEARVNVS